MKGNEPREAFHALAKALEKEPGRAAAAQLAALKARAGNSTSRRDGHPVWDALNALFEAAELLLDQIPELGETVDAPLRHTLDAISSLLDGLS